MVHAGSPPPLVRGAALDGHASHQHSVRLVHGQLMLALLGLCSCDAMLKRKHGVLAGCDRP